MTRKINLFVTIAAIVVILSAIVVSICYSFTTGRDFGNDGYYLMCYFRGNEPGEERVSMAISEDGYRFYKINRGLPMISQEVGTTSCRDPYIFRANGKYYIIATDMKSSDGWNSNHAMVIFESSDLINWGNQRIIDIKSKEGYEHTCRTWAPQVIFDKNVDKYLVYWSHCEDTDWDTHIVYAYLNDDFTDIGEIKDLYNPKRIAIDADIIYENNKYYLYYKDEDEKVIRYVYSDSLIGPYQEPQKSKVSTSWKDVEGSCMYKLHGTDTYIMIMDEYSNHNYYMQATKVDSMTKFKPVRNYFYSFDFKPRHASVIELTKDEYFEIKNWNTSVGMWPKEES